MRGESEEEQSSQLNRADSTYKSAVALVRARIGHGGQFSSGGDQEKVKVKLTVEILFVGEISP